MSATRLAGPVTLKSGRVSGVSADEGRCTVFKGIPFAAPPVGHLRWRAPAPVTPWSGVLQADRYASACLQPLHARDHLLAQLGFADIPECGISENCLYLNVWTPAADAGERLPVIVWLYGGGYRVGSGSHPVSEGEGLARNGVILVTLNYRLGALGFLAHPELTGESGSSGHYAVHDVLAGLQWVRENIVAFGGDPDCVTLFGQSAGGAIVNLLMASRVARGLMHRAIVHSAGRMQGGPMGGLRVRDAAEQDGARFMQSLQANSLAQMRLLAADRTYGVPRQWLPLLDGELVTEQPQATFDRGGQLQIPLLCGFTVDEASTFPAMEWQSRGGFESFVRGAFGDGAAWLISHYDVHDDASALRASYELRRDISFAYQPWKLARSHVASGAPVYLFQFFRKAPLPAGAHFHDPLPPGGYGAYHGAELWYVFNTLRHKPTCDWSAADRSLAETACAYWANFARSGDPNGSGLAAWPKFGTTNPNALLMGRDAATCVAGAVSNQCALEFFEERYAVRPSSPG